MIDDVVATHEPITLPELLPDAGEEDGVQDRSLERETRKRVGLWPSPSEMCLMLSWRRLIVFCACFPSISSQSGLWKV